LGKKNPTQESAPAGALFSFKEEMTMAQINIEKVVRKVEAEALAEAQARHADALALAEHLTLARAQCVEAKEKPEEVLAAAKRGEDVSPTALVEARAAAELAQTRATGIEARLRAAERIAPALDCIGAELLVPLFEEAISGVPVFATMAPAKRVIDALNRTEGPAIVICQESPTVRQGDGFVTVQTLKAVFVRPPWAADIRPDAVEGEGARKRAVNVKVQRNEKIGNYQLLTLNVPAGAEAVPVLPRIDQSRGVNDAVQGVGRQMSLRLGHSGDFPVIRNGVYSYTGPGMRMEIGGVNTKEDIGSEGMRTLTVAFVVNMHAPDYDPAYLHALPNSIETGGFQPHLGRLTHVEVAEATQDPRRGIISKKVTLNYESRVN
jgi:hypothetical protein